MPLESTFTPPQSSSFAKAIVEELIPWVDDHYHTSPIKNTAPIGGVSRGAAWAVQLGSSMCNSLPVVGAHSLPLFESDEAWLLGGVTQTPLENIPRFFIDIAVTTRKALRSGFCGPAGPIQHSS